MPERANTCSHLDERELAGFRAVPHQVHHVIGVASRNRGSDARPTTTKEIYLLDALAIKGFG